MAFRSNLQCFPVLRDDAALRRALASCAPALLEAVTYGRIVAGGWYPIEWYLELLHALAREGNGEPFVRLLGRHAARADLGGVYGALARSLSQLSLATVCAKLFSSYYSQCTVSELDAGPRHLRLEFSGCVGFDRMLFMHLLGCAEQVSELAGGRRPEGRILRGGAQGQEAATLHVTWT